MKNLTINSVYYSRSDLIKFSKSKIINSKFNWEKEIYKFILQWISNKNIFSFKTSGSTGKPKIIKFYRNELINSALLTQRTFNLENGSTALLSLPAEFIAGKMMIVRAFVLKLNLIIKKPSSNPFKNLNNIDFASVVPLQFKNGINNNLREVKSIKTILVGGGELKNNKMNFSNTFATYGMTETLTHIAIKKLNDKYFKAIGDVNFKIDKFNKLIIYAPHLKSKIIKTNDIVELKNKYSFKLIGRFDNVINTGGVKICPEVIENKIANLLSNNIYFVTSRKDKILGSKIILLIEGNIFPLQNLKSELKIRLNKFEQIKEIYFLKNFKYTKSGKINRSETNKILFKTQINRRNSKG